MAKMYLGHIENFTCIVLFHPPYSKYHYVGIIVVLFQFHMWIFYSPTSRIPDQISNCLLSISLWMFNRHLKFKISETWLLIFHLYCPTSNNLLPFQSSSFQVMATPDFRLHRPKPLESALTLLFCSHITSNLVSFTLYQNLATFTPPLQLPGFKLPPPGTWMTAVTSFCPCPLRVYSPHCSQRVPVKMKVQNPPAASHLTQSGNQRPCKSHQGQTSFLIFTSSLQTLNFMKSFVHLWIGVFFWGKPMWLVTRFLKDSKSPQSLRITAWRKPHSWKSNLKKGFIQIIKWFGRDSLFDERSHWKCLVCLQYNEIDKIKYIHLF